MTAGDVAVLLAVVVVLGALAWALTARAGHLDRMHVRVETTSAALDAALLRRAAATEALAASGALDPASALLLASAAAEAAAPERGVARVEREVAESDLTRALRAALGRGAVQVLHDRRDPVVEGLLADLATACERVVLARRFANDSVVAARRVRRGAVVRLAHLAGRARLPRTFDIDDEPPELAPVAGRPGPVAREQQRGGAA